MGAQRIAMCECAKYVEYKVIRFTFFNFITLRDYPSGWRVGKSRLAVVLGRQDTCDSKGPPPGHHSTKRGEGSDYPCLASV